MQPAQPLGSKLTDTFRQRDLGWPIAALVVLLLDARAERGPAG